MKANVEAMKNEIPNAEEKLKAEKKYVSDKIKKVKPKKKVKDEFLELRKIEEEFFEIVRKVISK